MWDSATEAYPRIPPSWCSWSTTSSRIHHSLARASWRDWRKRCRSRPSYDPQQTCKTSCDFESASSFRLHGPHWVHQDCRLRRQDQGAASHLKQSCAAIACDTHLASQGDSPERFYPFLFKLINNFKLRFAAAIMTNLLILSKFNQTWWAEKLVYNWYEFADNYYKLTWMCHKHALMARL